MLKGAKRQISFAVSRSFRGFHRKSEDPSAYLVALFVFLPGVILALGLVSRAPIALVGGLLTIYYLTALFVVAMKGLDWLEGGLS